MKWYHGINKQHSCRGNKSKLDFRIEGDTLHIDWIEGGDLAGRLRQAQEAAGSGIRKITGYTTDKLGAATDEAAIRLGKQIASKLEGKWDVVIQQVEGKRYVVLNRID